MQKQIAGKLLALTGSLCLIASTAEAKGGYVKGYFRSNGTYVAPYYRGSGSSSSSSVSSSLYSPATPTVPKGIPCGHSYISADKTCRIGSSNYKNNNFSSCDEASENGFANMTIGSTGYSPSLDRDNDGIACESGGDDTPGGSTGSGSGPVVGVSVMSPAPGVATIQSNSNTSGGTCPAFRLSTYGIVVDVPAVFPNPATTKQVDHYACGDTDITYTTTSPYSMDYDIVYKSGNWMAAWSKITADMDSSISPGINGRTDFTGQQIVFKPTSFAQGPDQDQVIGVSMNGQAVQPMAFNGQATAIPFSSGQVTVYQKGRFASLKFGQISVDTATNTITLKHEANWPK